MSSKPDFTGFCGLENECDKTNIFPFPYIDMLVLIINTNLVIALGHTSILVLVNCDNNLWQTLLKRTEAW